MNCFLFSVYWVGSRISSARGVFFLGPPSLASSRSFLALSSAYFAFFSSAFFSLPRFLILLWSSLIPLKTKLVTSLRPFPLFRRPNGVSFLLLLPMPWWLRYLRLLLIQPFESLERNCKLRWDLLFYVVY
jgi:hypothetical protein